MIYRWQGFLAVAWFGSSPTQSHILPSASCLSISRFPVSVEFAEGRGCGEEPNHATARKPGPLQIIQYSMSSTKNIGRQWCSDIFTFSRIPLGDLEVNWEAGSGGPGIHPPHPPPPDRRYRSPDKLILLVSGFQVNAWILFILFTNRPALKRTVFT